MNNNNNKNNRKLKAFTLVVFVLLALTGVSYAFFSYSFLGKENTIKTDDISIKLLESTSEVITVTNSLPMGDSEGMKQTDTGNVFDFAVETKTKQDKNLGYKLNIEKLGLDEGYNSLEDDQIKIYLTDENDNKIIGPVKISELDNYNLYEDMNIHNKDNSLQIDKYRIRVWIDIDVDASNWDENTKLEYKFKIGVGSSDKEGTYNVSYSSNGGEGKMAPSVYERSTEEVLRKNTYTRGGYTFKGWSTTSNGEVEYQDQIKATELTKDENNKNKTLYAVWNPNNYIIKYHQNGGMLPASFILSGTYSWEEVNGVYRSGNYNVNSSTSTMKSNEFTLTESSNISFEWAVSSESASYDYLYYTIYKDGTALSDTGTSTKIGGNYSITNESNLTYTTVTKPLEAGTYYIEFSYKKDSSQHKGLDRGYVKNLVIPGYDKDKTMEDSSFTVGQNNKLQKNKYIRTGHTFKGWSTNKNGTNIKYQDENELTEIEKKVKEQEQIDLYAIWEIDKFTVNVVVQNGTVDVASKEIPYDENGTFNLMTNVEGAIGSVTCTNNQVGKIENNILTVSNVSANTTCTVNFKDTFTTLYEDGTLIINESAKNRNANLSTHGNITKEYDAMSDSNSYVMSSDSSQPWYNEQTSIKSVEIGQKIEPISTAYWFYWLSNMEKGNFTNLDTSSVTNMKSMFESAGNKATTWSIGGLSNWDVSKVTSMNSMFNSAGNKATTWSIGGLSNWNTSSVTSMSGMFHGAGFEATTWSIGDLSNWDTSKVTDMETMFYEAGRDATTFDIGNLSNWNVSKVTDMSSMFYQAGMHATTFDIGDLSNWNVSKVTDMSSMFSEAGCNATTWSIGDLSNWNTSSVTNMKYMFERAGYRATTFNLDLSSWDTSSVTNMSYMFYYAGDNATTWSVKIPSKTGELTNTTSKWYGSSESVYATPASGKSFTLVD